MALNCVGQNRVRARARSRVNKRARFCGRSLKSYAIPRDWFPVVMLPNAIHLKLVFVVTLRQV